MSDFVLNGQGTGNVAQLLLANRMDPRILRPWLGDNGQTYINVNHATKPGEEEALVVNATTGLLRKNDWIQLDTAVIKAAQAPLSVVKDLRSGGLTYNIPNGMAKTSLQHERQSDINPATISMDGLKGSNNDRPVWDLQNMPLPIIHKDFQMSARALAASREGGSPLDTSTAELAARKVAEEAEKLALGTSNSYAFGGGTIYGMTNFPQRLTKALTLPTNPGWVPGTLVNEVLAMRQQSMDNYFYGPWKLYTSPSWDTYLDDDYSAAKGDNTLRERLAKIKGISGIETANFLSGFQMVLVQQTTDVIRLVTGMDIITVQWETNGGLMLNFKVMCIIVPQLRCDQYDRTGIVHGTAA
jgi:uncharacterized linocin/CFP29 family protein